MYLSDYEKYLFKQIYYFQVVYKFKLKAYKYSNF